MRNIFPLILFFISDLSFPQSNKDVFDYMVTLNNGIYSTYREVLRNSPKYPDCSLRIQHQLLDTAYYEYVDKNSVIHDYNDFLFAIVNNGILYIRLKKGFYKVIIRGAISIFNKELMYTYLTNGYTMSEDHIFLVDFETGNIMRLIPKTVEGILERDTLLYKEFSTLPASKKRKSLYPYILKYNERNPILMD